MKKPSFILLGIFALAIGSIFAFEPDHKAQKSPEVTVTAADYTATTAASPLF